MPLHPDADIACRNQHIGCIYREIDRVKFQVDIGDDLNIHQ
jgi:hypothetical protein